MCWLWVKSNLLLFYVAEFLHFYSWLVCPQAAFIMLPSLLLGTSHPSALSGCHIDAPFWIPGLTCCYHRTNCSPPWPPDISAFPEEATVASVFSAKWSVGGAGHPYSCWLHSSELYYGILASEDRGVHSDKKENSRQMAGCSLQRWTEFLVGILGTGQDGWQKNLRLVSTEGEGRVCWTEEGKDGVLNRLIPQDNGKGLSSEMLMWAWAWRKTAWS